MTLALLLACRPTGDIATPTPPPTSVCGSTDLLDAPPPIESSAGLLGAVDLLSIDATASLTDGAMLTIDAEARFLVGDDGGLPTFELGPDSTMELDGEPVDFTRVTVADPPREVVVLEALEPCSEHTLRVTHTLDQDWMDDGGQIRLETLQEGTYWASGLEDASPGRFLSMWTMSNLLFDRFDLTLVFDTDGLTTPHQLVSTGEPVGGDPDIRAWSDIQAHTPFWVISPLAQTQSAYHVVELSEGPIELEIHALTDDFYADLTEAHLLAEGALVEFDNDFGAYRHGERYILWIRSDQGGSMEYDGATITAMGAIEHEILHSWFARGASPIADLHGWVDEAITSWVADFGSPAVDSPLADGSQPLQQGDSEWAGPSLAVDNYLLGTFLFAQIAHLHSVEEVKAAMFAFHLDYDGRSYRGSDLEEHLTCWFDDERVRQAFQQRAHGVTEPGPRPDDWCQGSGAL